MTIYTENMLAMDNPAVLLWVCIAATALIATIIHRAGY